MCENCGCGNNDKGYKILKPQEVLSEIEMDANHHHSSVLQETEHHHPHSINISLKEDLLMQNNLLAERNRGYFEAKNIMVVNLVSSPGAGKTTLLEKTIRHFASTLKIYVIEGDQQTTIDATRISNAGAMSIQINTGNGCHLDAEMIQQGVKSLDPISNSTLFIENVGNLVCPALFDLGETKRVIIASTTEGDDKPLKYPTMFASSDLCILNKLDLQPYVNFNVAKFKESALHINHHLAFLEMSAQTEEGLDKWYKWIIETQAKQI